jgi:pyridoxine 5-phosphate synthase
MAIKLSVNVNKIATLRNARGGNVPNVLQMALDIERYGANGITVHPRPDERHIRFTDVYELKNNLTTDFNIEGYPTAAFIKMVMDVKPHQVTLVPDAPEVLTSNAGWNTVTHQTFLKEKVHQLAEAGIMVSLFVDTHLPFIEAAKTTGTHCIELYTEAYAQQFETNAATAIAPYVEAGSLALNLGLRVNAGHDLNMYNLAYFAKHLPWVNEVSIGHALISDALYYGIENTVKMYLRCLNQIT